ncbi:MAG: hypothetical protein JXA52_04875 [Planctomycetes bacterium]|nr:hypothetical protein [Planctomycetota bacterium]
MAKLLQLNEITEGMVSAHDIMTNDGHVLLAGGTRLTAKHLELLQKREVESLLIKEPGEELVEINAELAQVEQSSSSVVIRLAQEQLRLVFAKVRGDKLMDKLFSLAMNRVGQISIAPEGKSDG